jgi:flagellar protein FlaG
MKLENVASPVEIGTAVPPFRRPPPAEASRAQAQEGTVDPPSAPSKEEMERISSAVKKFLEEHQSVVSISMDEELQQFVIKILDKESGKVIQQFPPDELLSVMRQLREMRGILLNKKG